MCCKCNLTPLPFFPQYAHQGPHFGGNFVIGFFFLLLYAVLSDFQSSATTVIIVIVIVTSSILRRQSPTREPSIRILFVISSITGVLYLRIDQQSCGKSFHEYREKSSPSCPLIPVIFSQLYANVIRHSLTRFKLHYLILNAPHVSI